MAERVQSKENSLTYRACTICSKTSGCDTAIVKRVPSGAFVPFIQERLKQSFNSSAAQESHELRRLLAGKSDLCLSRTPQFAKFPRYPQGGFVIAGVMGILWPTSGRRFEIRPCFQAPE
jgi:hypothetical protein